MDKRWISLIILSLITVSIWIIMEIVFITLHKGETIPDYSYYLKPVVPNFNEKSLELIQEREEEFIQIEPGGLD